MNVVYEFVWTKRMKAGIKPFRYIGSKTNCRILNDVIIDSHDKEYWSSCEQQRFKDAMLEEIPEVRIIASLEIDDIINRERDEQLKVEARDNEDYFNLVYAGGGFGVFGDSHPAKRPEVRANMKATNYMNRDDYRPWKTSRANPHDWALADVVYNSYINIKEIHGTAGWRRVLSHSNLSISFVTIKSMIIYFNKGWVPNNDPEFIELVHQVQGETLHQLT